MVHALTNRTAAMITTEVMMELPAMLHGRLNIAQPRPPVMKFAVVALAVTLGGSFHADLTEAMDNEMLDEIDGLLVDPGGVLLCDPFEEDLCEVPLADPFANDASPELACPALACPTLASEG
mmetsp:Transcript_81599/g.182413  ORF Transcript_81599/g.182413 Transcript_81599/m.182413 type:complete len:122 (-) Transcript_81599:43-408(-)